MPQRLTAIIRVLTTGAAAATVLIAAMAAEPARAQGRLEAKYEASLAGIPVGDGNWTIEIGSDHYISNAYGSSGGLLNIFGRSSGHAIAQGKMVGGALAPASYVLTTTSSKKSETVRIGLAGGAAKDIAIEPSPPPDTNRIPVTDAHRRSVFDPMSGALLQVAGSGEPVAAESCRSATPIFDGRMRYDLKLDFKRIETVKVDGYSGHAVVCGVSFQPIAGYVPDRATIRYLAAQKHMEVWFAPIVGTRYLVPFRVTVPTPLGTAMLQARRFVTSPFAKAAARTQ